MKKMVMTAMMLMVFFAAVAAEVWEMKNPAPWARDGKKIEISNKNGNGFDLRYEGTSDFSVHGMPVIDVKPGDKFSFSCDTTSLEGVEKQGRVSLSVILYDGKGKVLRWVYGGTSGAIGGKLSSEFAVPFGVSKIQGRIAGSNSVAVRMADIKLERVGNVLDGKQVYPPGELSLSNDCSVLTVPTKTSGLSVTDKRTGQTWKTVAQDTGGAVAVNASKTNDKISVTFMNFETLCEYTAEFQFDKNACNEFLVTISGKGKLERALNYPLPLASRHGDRLIIPMNEGISYPVEEDDIGPAKRLIAYGGHGICMAFFGVQSDAKGDGWMAIVETPDDAAMIACRGADKLWTLGPSWVAQKKMFGYCRRIRYVFLDKGGFVAMAKRYRDYAKKINLFKPFTEKVKERPNVDRLLGAVNLWFWNDSHAVDFIKKLEDAGIDRILFSGGGSEKTVKTISEMPDHLISRYDVYQDIYHPEQLKKLGWKGKGNWNTDAWPHDVMWNSENSNDWTRAWGVKAKDGTWTYCANMCDATAPKYERRNVTEELKKKPYNTRFIDTTVASQWRECYNPAHPMTRTQSKNHRMELLRILGDEFGLVVGSETGHDASVPFCDYYEGMLSLGPYRVPDSGRRIQEIWTNVPPQVAKYQVGEKYRLPLWELVYHDCVCAHWYWGDYNNKLPDLWHKRDLFNVLYGTMGMFVTDLKKWEADKDKYVRSFKITSPVARQTGYSEMTDFRILSKDRSVQQSRFANGIVVTVNFGETDYTLPDGTRVKASDYHVEGLK